MSITLNSSAPQPVVISPSQLWDGSDGRWSSFSVRVGTPEQLFRVFPSNTIGETYVPLPQGCKDTDPSNCGDLRGVYTYQDHQNNGFLANSSSTWSEIGIYQLGLRPQLNSSASGLYGLETVGLMVPNSGGPTLSRQVVAGIVTKSLYVGVFGLSPKAANFSGLDHPQISYMQTLRNNNQIPSLSYGYTAGAYYKSPKVFGNLVLGGYDQSRLVPNNISFSFDPADSKPTSLNVQSIDVRNTLNGSVWAVLDDATYFQIDSTVPHLWLPRKVCDSLETLVGLHYDNGTDLYTVNDTTHNQLVTMNPTITIGLGTTSDPAQRVSVALPYGAFDLQATYPNYPNATRYFPIRRALNDSQYILGRTFLQEAYIVVDHERLNFSVHQALFPSTTDPQQIISIVSPSYATYEKSSSMKRLHGGEIAGTVVGVVAFIALCIIMRNLVVRRQRTKRRAVEETNQKTRLEEEMVLDEKRHMELSGGEVFEMKSPAEEIGGSPQCELGGQGLHELPTETPTGLGQP